MARIPFTSRFGVRQRRQSGFDIRYEIVAAHASATAFVLETDFPATPTVIGHPNPHDMDTGSFRCGYGVFSRRIFRVAKGPSYILSAGGCGGIDIIAAGETGMTYGRHVLLS